ncbi:PREDICTED: hormone-sensitive lipase-like [Priapulus caudatus]|uniref:Hormone-sensitive lipase-like n=1 Tax=Priapulus caudatus TaxID=37621 RepID=A0ABM1E7D5_PRICU|nr:PREDICTED: hormone-sensitive lipase-like [Priapulus caudatus]
MEPLAEMFNVSRGINPFSARSVLFKTVRSLALSNMEYYQDDMSSYKDRLYTAFSNMHDHLEKVEPYMEILQAIGAKYDFDATTPGNGYRSIVQVIDACVLKLLRISRDVCLNRESFLFLAGHKCRDVEAYTDVLGVLRQSLKYFIEFDTWCDDGQLFPHEKNVPWDILREMETFNHAAFHGRAVAFQYCGSLSKPLQVVSVAMASFSEGFYKHANGNMMQRATTSLLHSGKYLLNPEMKGQQIVNVTKNASIQFCKAFWNIPETDVFHQLPQWMTPQASVNRLFSIEPHGFTLPRRDGCGSFDVPPPTAHKGPAPVHVRLLSYIPRKGQFDASLPGVDAPQPLYTTERSRCLIIHCHGGGFVAQSSKSHEIYLRMWTKDLQVPILSIDYSLAPESPFPRALEEIFFIYCWALKNCHLLGSTGERICVVGDSAGGNLVTALTLRAITNGVRVPDGLLTIYTPFVALYTPSPSRLLSMLDPLLPLGILARCLAAYAGLSPQECPELPPEPALQRSSSTSNIREDILSFLGSFNRWTTAAPPPAPTDAVQRSRSTVDFTDEIATPPAAAAPTPKVRRMSCTSISERDDDDDDDDDGDCGAPAVTFGLDDLDETMEEDEDEGAEKKEEEEVAVPGLQRPSSAGRLRRRSLKLNGIIPTHGGAPTHGCASARDSDGGAPTCDITPTHGSAPARDSNDGAPNQTVHAGVNGTVEAPLHVTIPDAADKEQQQTTYRHTAQSPVVSPLEQFIHLKIDRNPFMSPLFADDSLLREMPPTTIMACHLDPLLDDSVMFAKRLRALRRDVRLHMFEQLPHGFLNFTVVSSDAKQASEMCAARLGELLGLQQEGP